MKDAARAVVENRRDELVGLSERIHATPELAYEETRSCAWTGEALADAGFSVTERAGGIGTAFVARYGSGPLRIGICAEYDALPGIGHACGHNIIAASSVGASMALATVADELGIEVVCIGTPAEEGGGGKIVLLDAGVFDDLQLAMMVHPAPMDAVDPTLIAADWLQVSYTGKEAHASAFPEAGINAADALVVAQTAIGLLRQHLRPTDRVHGIVTHGGDASNIIPAHTAGHWQVRAASLDELSDVREKVTRCFEAGAIATGATLQLTPSPFSYAEVHHHAALGALYRRNAEQLGRVFPEVPLRAAASTDMGNVSLKVPSLHPFIAVDARGASNHQREFAAACVGASAEQALVDAAVAMAWTAIDVGTSDDLRRSLIG